jgi:DNA-binding transcriptional ArsR family regulator
LIDRIRHDIQQRLDQLLAEADKLRHALIALTGRDVSDSGRTPQSRAAPPAARSQSRSTTKSASPTAKTSAEPKPPTPRARTASGATKSAVLAALATGEAMTAGDVATATGLGRASVSTTLSKLAKAGEVTKVERGYRLAEPSKPGE